MEDGIYKMGLMSIVPVYEAQLNILSILKKCCSNLQ